ncbi:Synaptogyrin [Carabus blaptoides fortunei]
MEEDRRFSNFIASTDVNREFEDIGTGSFLIQDDILQSNEEKQPGVMLEPDHPLLERFQKLLKQQLERQISKLTEEVSDLEIGIKEKFVEREAFGNKIFDAQQLLIDQQRVLDKHENEIKQFSTERTEIENDLQSIKQHYKRKRDTLIQAEQKEFDVINDIDAHNFMLQNITKWDEKIQSQLHVKQRLTDISKLNRKGYSKDKRNLDFYIYKLMTEVFRLEKSNENMTLQFQTKLKEREELGRAIAQMNADIESLEYEHKHLINSWKNVLVGIGYQDKEQRLIIKDLEQVKEILHATLVETQSYKKMSAREMKRNEFLTIKQYHLDIHLESVQRRLDTEIGKLSQVQEKLDELQAEYDEVSKEKEQYTIDATLKRNALNEIQYEIEQNKVLKMQLEDKILHMLEEQIVNDTIAKSTNMKIISLREKNRSLEVQSNNMENENSKIYYAIQDQKEIGAEIPALVAAVREQIKEAEIELLPYKHEMKDLIVEFKVTRNDYNDAHAEHHRLFYMSWRVLKKHPRKRRRELRNVVRREIRKIRKDSKMEKYYWVRKQRYIVVKRIQRKRQVEDMIITERQSSLLDLKVPKILFDLEDVTKLANIQFEKTMNAKIKLDELKEQLRIKKGLKYTFGMDHSVFRTVCSSELKDAELECIKLEAELMQIEENKDALCKELLELNRDHEMWKHKCNNATSIKMTIAKENGAEGEIGNMKAEIHRMNIRYSQLRKAQEKLVQDLNICLSRREFIFSTAEATEKRLALGRKQVSNHIHFKRKLEEQVLKLKKADNHRRSIEKQLSDAYKAENDMYETIAATERAIKDVEKVVSDWLVQISNAKLARRLDGDICLTKQHNALDYVYVLKGQYYINVVYRSRLDTEFSRLRNMEGVGAYGGGKAGGSFDPITFVQRPQVILRAVCWLFSIIVFGCISSQGWQLTPDNTTKETCLYNNDPNACNYGVGISVIAFLASMGFLAGEYLFEQMSSVKTRKHYVLADLGFSGFWSFLYFVGFCYLAKQWGSADPPINGVGVNNVQAAIVFSFFSILTWAGCAFFAFQRFRQGADAAFAPSYEVEGTMPGGAPYTSYPIGIDGDQQYQEPPFSAGPNQRGPGDFQAPAY